MTDKEKIEDIKQYLISKKEYYESKAEIDAFEVGALYIIDIILGKINNRK